MAHLLRETTFQPAFDVPGRQSFPMLPLLLHQPLVFKGIKVIFWNMICCFSMIMVPGFVEWAHFREIYDRCAVFSGYVGLSTNMIYHFGVGCLKLLGQG